MYKFHKLFLFTLFFSFACANELEEAITNQNTGISSEDFRDTITGALNSNHASHEESGDYSYNSDNATSIVCEQNQVSITGSGASFSGKTIQINEAGSYILSGTLNDGQIHVNVNEEGIVKIVLDNITISNSTNAPVYIEEAQKTVLLMTENSVNTFSDASSYQFDTGEDEPNACIFSKDNLSIAGNGTMNVTGNYSDGITSKDGLIIHSGKYNIVTADDGIRGKDYLIIDNGIFEVQSGGDAFKSDNDEDATCGYMLINSGDFNITAYADAFSATSDVLIETGSYVIETRSANTNTSFKAFKSGVNMIINNGTFSCNVADDAFHSNGNLIIKKGNYQIATNDDAIHADSTLTITDGTFNIFECYEGIESAAISIAGGSIHVTSSDDGINAADGTNADPHGGGPGFPGSSGSCTIIISGGYMVLNTSGDGIDANGSVTMSNGSLIINGPTQNNNSALDYDGSFTMDGGFIIAVGSSGMAQAPGSNSSQYSALINLNHQYSANNWINIQNSDENILCSFLPSKAFQSIMLSTPDLIYQSTYDLYIGGSAEGSNTDGLIMEGTYTPGTKYTNFTISQITTKVGNSGAW